MNFGENDNAIDKAGLISSRYGKRLLYSSDLALVYYYYYFFEVAQICISRKVFTVKVTQQ